MSISDGIGNVHNTTGTLESIRAVREIPNTDGFIDIERTLSASSFESLHSIDHGSLAVESNVNPHTSMISQDGPWTVYTRKPEPTGCYQAKFEPPTHPYPRPPPPHPNPEYVDDPVDSRAACPFPITGVSDVILPRRIFAVKCSPELVACADQAQRNSTRQRGHCPRRCQPRNQGTSFCYSGPTGATQ